MKYLIIAFWGLSFFGKKKDVYVCDSEYATAYHFDPICVGLTNCTHDVIEIPVDSAIKRDLHRCYMEK